MRAQFANYNPDLAPAILMPEKSHLATFAVYNQWRAAMRAQMGGTFDWARVSEAQMRALSQRMFDAAQVPAPIRREYWSQYEAMLRALQE